MPRNLWTRGIVVLVVLLGSVWYLYPPKQTLNLGLDLQGGIHLVLGVQVDKHVASQTDRAPNGSASARRRETTFTFSSDLRERRATSRQSFTARAAGIA